MLRTARAVASGAVCVGHVGCCICMLYHVDMKTEFHNVRCPGLLLP